MKNTILNILAFLVILAMGVGIGFVAQINKPIVKLVPVQDLNYVQNIGEAQQRLKEQGLYHGKIDGIWGTMTDKAYCDWAAIQTFKDEYYEKDSFR